MYGYGVTVYGLTSCFIGIQIVVNPIRAIVVLFCHLGEIVLWGKCSFYPSNNYL